MLMCGRLGIEAVEAFEEAARDLEVEGSGWTAAEAHGRLEDDIAAHVRQLEHKKVRAANAPVGARSSLSCITLFPMVTENCTFLLPITSNQKASP